MYSLMLAEVISKAEGSSVYTFAESNAATGARSQLGTAVTEAHSMPLRLKLIHLMNR